MFSVLFQENDYFTLGILKGFLTENTEIHGIPLFPGQLKNSTTGCGFPSRGPPKNNTVSNGFQRFPGFRRVCR